MVFYYSPQDTIQGVYRNAFSTILGIIKVLTELCSTKEARASTAQLRTASRQVGGTETQSHQEKPTPSRSDPQPGGTHRGWVSSLRSEGSKLYMQHPDPEILHRREKPPKHLALKTIRESNLTRKTIGLPGTENLLSKGLSADSLNLKTSAKTSD